MLFIHPCCKVEQIWRSLKVCSLRCQYYSAKMDHLTDSKITSPILTRFLGGFQGHHGSPIAEIEQLFTSRMRLHAIAFLPLSGQSVMQLGTVGTHSCPFSLLCLLQPNTSFGQGLMRQCALYVAGHFSPFTGPQGDIVNRPSKGRVNHEVERGRPGRR